MFFISADSFSYKLSVTSLIKRSRFEIIMFLGAESSSKRRKAFISRMFEDPRFVEKIKTRWTEKKYALEQTFADDGIIQNLAEEIKVSADLNFIKWSILGVYVWPNASGYEDRLTFQDEIDYMKFWLSERFTWLDSAIDEL